METDSIQARWLFCEVCEGLGITDFRNNNYIPIIRSVKREMPNE